jgi:type I restriction enzyme M protein
LAEQLEALSEEEHAKNNLPDVLMRWEERNGSEKGRERTAQGFCVPKAEFAASRTYDLSLNRYKRVEHEEQIHAAPADIIRELRALEKDISSGHTPCLRICWDELRAGSVCLGSFSATI